MLSLICRVPAEWNNSLTIDILFLSDYPPSEPTMITEAAHTHFKLIGMTPVQRKQHLRRRLLTATVKYEVLDREYDITGTLFVYLFVSSKTSPVHCSSIYLFPVRHRRYIVRLSVCFFLFWILTYKISTINVKLKHFLP